MDAFTECWRVGSDKIDRIVDLLGPDIRLSAPGLRPTVGKEAGREAFRLAFSILPDLRAQVHGWSANEDALFIEMTFSATIGGAGATWNNVDRFLFQDGVAIERLAYFDQRELRGRFLRGPRGWLHMIRGLTSGIRARCARFGPKPEQLTGSRRARWASRGERAG